MTFAARDEHPAAEAKPLSVGLREPVLEDAKRIWHLSRDSGVLDQNSPYAYLLVCSEFAADSVVATADGELLGFVCGLRTAARPDTLFVWQIAVAAHGRQAGIARRMLDTLVRRRPAPQWIEATVTLSNVASAALFRSLAKRWNTSCHESPRFPSDLFPASGHEPEELFRIGPFPSIG